MPEPRNNYISLLANAIYNFIAPHLCLMCKNSIEDSKDNRSQYICNKCFDNLDLAPNCEIIKNELIVNLDKDNLYIDHAYCLYTIRTTREFLNVIHSLKYKNKRNIGIEFGSLLWRKIRMETIIDYDYIIPLPIHIARKRERGYNQSDYICKGIRQSSQLPIERKIIKRYKYTKSQTSLHPEDRKINVSNIFKTINQAKIVNKKILIVDDVLTTGATLNSIAKTLKQSGAEIVDIATILRA